MRGASPSCGEKRKCTVWMRQHAMGEKHVGDLWSEDSSGIRLEDSSGIRIDVYRTTPCSHTGRSDPARRRTGPVLFQSLHPMAKIRRYSEQARES
jgi:hypothetical protein